MDEPNGKEQPEKHKPIPLLGLRYESRNVHADITILGGMFRRVKGWLDANWKRASYHSALLTLIISSLLNGFSIKDATITSRQRLSVLEIKATEVDVLKVEVGELKRDITGLKEVSSEDGVQLEKAEKLERNQKRRQELKEYNKARAEKLKKIGQLPAPLYADTYANLGFPKEN